MILNSNHGYQNWHGLESAASSYIELKLAISANEKGRKKRAVRIVLEDDYGLSKTMALEKMYQRLDDLFNSDNKENNSTQKKEKEMVTKSSSLNEQKQTQENENKIEKLKSEFIQTIIQKLDLNKVSSFLSCHQHITSKWIRKVDDFKKAMGYSNNTKWSYNRLLGEKVEIT